ncbi:MAG: serine hydrolase [Saprospiraceae bacterium]|nr:serine hydrolase [Saprospiraceae bacterium]
MGLQKIQAQSLYFPPAGPAWETIDPITELNWCQEKLDTLQSFLLDRDSKAFIILKGGKIAVEWYYDGFTKDSIWYWASAGKSLTSTLVGIAQQEGFLDLDDPTSDYLGTGWTACSPADEEKITIRHQLTMTSGLDDGLGDVDCTDPACLECLAEPGTRWAYHNAPYTLLDQVIAGATGSTINNFFATRIGSKIGAVGLYLKLGFNNVFFSRPRDMARFGLLIQAKGTWNGTPVLSDTNYYNLMVNTSQDLNKSYGYLWWLNGKGQHMLPGLQFKFNQDLIPTAPDDLFAGLGKNDQKVYIVPSQDLVVVRMGNSAGPTLPALSGFDSQLWTLIGDLSCTSSTHPAWTEPELHLWPNPARSIVTIDGFPSGGRWELSSITGQEIRKGDQHTVDVAALPAGSYVLTIRSESGEIQNRQLLVH